MLVGGCNVESNRFPCVTMMLIVLNVAMFFQPHFMQVKADQELREKSHMLRPGNVDSVLKQRKALQSYYEDYGFSAKDITERHEYYSIVTHMFVHGGLMHLIGNMLMLWGIGVAMESALGSKAYFVFYFVCGLVAALAQGFTDIASDIPCVGASGAIAGLMGGFFILFGADAKLKILMWIFLIPRVFEVPALVFAIFWMGQQVLGASADLGGVAWMAHIGGCVAGGSITLLIRNSLTCEIETNRDGTVQIKHDDSAPASESDLFEQVLDLHPVKVVVDEILGCDAPVFCPKCSAVLDLNNQIGERLIRCNGCNEITYIDSEILIRSREQAKLAEPTV